MEKENRRIRTVSAMSLKHKDNPLREILSEELLYGIEGNELVPVIQIAMDRSRYDDLLLVVTFQQGKCGLTHVTGMGLLPVDQQHGALDLVSESQDTVFIRDVDAVSHQLMLDPSERGWYPRSVL